MELETNELLKMLFPDILYSDPKRQSPKWSEDDGIVVKRKSNRSEATLEAWGLVDGQPTSKHFSTRVYDDVVTIDTVGTQEQIEKTTNAWAMSDNLGTPDGICRIVGTTYAYADTYAEIERRGAAIVRRHPGTEDGTREGKPVLMSREQLEQKRRQQGVYVFASQILLNPTPEGSMTFRVEWARKYTTAPQIRNAYIFVDPANSKKTKTADYTVMLVMALAQDGNWYLMDAVRDRLSLTERADHLFRLHRQWHPLDVYYQEYGIEADRQHVVDRQDREAYRFLITPVSSRMRKEDRISRLVPLFEYARIYLPDKLLKTDWQGLTRDLVTDFIDHELVRFPATIVHDDMLDAMAMIADPDLSFSAPELKSEDEGSTRIDRYIGEAAWMM